MTEKCGSLWFVKKPCFCTLVPKKIIFYYRFKVPDGYERKNSVDNSSSYFVNVFTGVRWYSAETDAGKIYYYEENGNESCWDLPNVSQSIQVGILL